MYVYPHTVPAGTSSACEFEPEVLVVCRMFVFVMMLHARGNLDFPALRALGPLRAYKFWRLHFCIIVRDELEIFFQIFEIDFDLHFGSMLASFSMFVAFCFRSSILHGFVINVAIISIFVSQ